MSIWFKIFEVNVVILFTHDRAGRHVY